MSEKKKKETMYDKLNDEQKAVQIPYFIHEMQMTRMDKINKRLWIALILLVILLVGTNAGWIIYESQFVDEAYSYEVMQDSGEGGQNTYTGNTVKIMGGDYNGEAESESDGEAEVTEDGR